MAKAKRILSSPFASLVPKQEAVVNKLETDLAAIHAERATLGGQKTSEANILSAAERRALVRPLVSGAKFPLPHKTMAEIETVLHILERLTPELVTCRREVLVERDSVLQAKGEEVQKKLDEAKAELKATEDKLANA